MRVIGLAGGLLAACGCNDDDAAARARVHERPFAGETVAVAVPQGLGFGETWKPILDEWSEQTGATYRLVEYAPTKPDPSAGDAFVLPFADVPQFAVDDRLARIPSASISSGRAAAGLSSWLDFFTGLRERVLSVGGSPTVISLSCPVLTCYVRRDLLEKAGLKPPATWDEYQALIDSLPRWGAGLKVVEPWSEEFRATMFLSRALAHVKAPGGFSVFFDIDSGEPLIASPGFVRGLTQAVAATAKLPPEIKQLSPADCRRMILTGQAAMAIAFEPGRADEKPLHRARDIAVSFIRMPGARQVYQRESKTWQAPPNGELNQPTLAPFSGLVAGVVQGIPAKRSQAAWNLVMFVGLDHYERALANVPKSICRESQLSGSSTWVSPDLRPQELFGYLGATADSLRDVNVIPELGVIDRDEFRRSLTAGVTAALEGKAAPEAALQKVAAHWSELTKRLGTDRVRDSYRKCLGIPAAVKLPDMPAPADAR